MLNGWGGKNTSSPLLWLIPNKIKLKHWFFALKTLALFNFKKCEKKIWFFYTHLDDVIIYDKIS